jgi:hypothetical protein
MDVGLKRERIKENICGDVSTWTQSIFFRSGMSSKQGHISSQIMNKMAGFVTNIYKMKSLLTLFTEYVKVMVRKRWYR